ncbi:MAG: GAF domain-containing protein [Chloroflexi bacterium]|nr:MAG: GAF domain-containing protein [Chloroflexota bacterium]
MMNRPPDYYAQVHVGVVAESRQNGTCGIRQKVTAQAKQGNNKNPAPVTDSANNRSPKKPITATETVTNNQFERLVNELKEITNLFNIGVAAASSLNIDEVLWTMFKESSRLINTQNFAIALYDASTDRLNFQLVFDQGHRVKSRSVKLGHGGGLATRVLTKRTPLLIGDLLKKGDHAKESTHQNQHVRSWLGVPLLNPILPTADALGVIATWSYMPNAFSDHDLWLLSAVATQTAIAARNASLHERVLAERDRAFEAEEQARKALARDLHDGPTQLLSAISMRLDYCQTLWKKDPQQVPYELESVRKLAKRAVSEIRTMLFELRPLILETDGLVPALKTLVDRWQQDMAGRSQTTTLTFRAKPMEQSRQFPRQDKKTEAALYAIIQEIVNNAIKHAQASRISLELQESEKDIRVTVVDDGIGFELESAMRQAVQRGSMGLVNIRERTNLIGGELTIHSSPGQGTITVVRVAKAEIERKKRRSATGPLSPLFSLMAKPSSKSTA